MDDHTSVDNPGEKQGTALCSPPSTGKNQPLLQTDSHCSSLLLDEFDATYRETRLGDYFEVSGRSTWGSELVQDVFHRINRDRIYENFIVEMRAGREACVTNIPDDVPSLHLLPNLDREL